MHSAEVGSQTRIQSVSRAIRILLAIAESPDGLAAKEVASLFSLTLPTAYHLLTTLSAEGMVIKDERRHFRLGPRVGIIADAYARSDALPSRYVEAINALAAKTGESTYLSVWRNGGVSVLATAEGDHAVRVVGLNTGYSNNIHARASGKLLLSYVAPEARDEIIAGLELTALTPNTITTTKALREEIEQIRGSGIAFEIEEFQDGVACVSSPIMDNDHVVACITVSSPTHRFEQKRDEIIGELRRQTDTLSTPRA